MDVPVFVVNLKKSVDRREYMQQLCVEYGLVPTFIEAVYGKELTDAEINTVYDEEQAISKLGRGLMLGEIGCALSHRKIYQKMVNENIDIALVLEDDAKFDSSIMKVLNLVKHFPKNWELILLGHYAGHENEKEIASPISFWDKHRLNSNIKLGRLAGYGFGTHGYFLNQKGAIRLLKELERIYRPIDHYTSDDNIINVFAMIPTVIKVQQEFETMIDLQKLRTSHELSFLKKLFSYLKLLVFLQKINKLRKSLTPLKKYR